MVFSNDVCVHWPLERPWLVRIPNRGGAIHFHVGCKEGKGLNTWCFAVGLAAVKDPPYEVGEALKGTRPVSPASTAAAAISIKGRRNKNMGDRGWLVELLCFRLWGDVSPTLHTLALLHSPCSLRFQNGENHPWQLACSGTPEFSRITGSPPCPCTSSII